MRFEFLVAAVVAVAGAGLLAAGVASLRVGTPDDEVAKVKALPVADGARWATLAPGTEVLVEGIIAPDAPVLVNELVVVRRERDRSQTLDRHDWVSVETLTPALSLEANGRVVLRDGYALRGTCTEWQGAPERERVAGYRRGDRVVAGGRVTPTGLAADFLFCGDVAGWYARVREDTEAATVLGPLFSLVGAGLLGAACALVWRGRRKRGAR